MEKVSNSWARSGLKKSLDGNSTTTTAPRSSTSTRSSRSSRADQSGVLGRPVYQPRTSRKRTDDKGDYIFCPGELIADRYEVQKSEPIGKGAFGVVLQALDREQGVSVAVKIVKAKSKFAKQADNEARLLRRMRRAANLDTNEGGRHVVMMQDHFAWAGHECIVFELLSHSLYDVLSFSKFRGVSLNLVRKFAVQILRGLVFMRRSDLDIIHCDLKPENVLLCEPSQNGQIKIIDFGSSCTNLQQLHKYIQSRWYRAPEVLLGTPYDASVDMWSMGCILSELHTGKPLFPGGHEPLTRRSASHDMLCRFSRVLGPIPSAMISNAMQVADQVESNKRMGRDSQKRTSIDMRDENFHCELEIHATHENPKAELGKLVGANTSGLHGRWLHDRHHTPAHYELFVDFLESTLRFDPAVRMDPSAGLQHPFLNDAIWNSIGSGNGQAEEPSVGNRQRTGSL